MSIGSHLVNQLLFNFIVVSNKSDAPCDHMCNDVEVEDEQFVQRL